MWVGGGGTTTDQCTINAIGAVIKTYFCPSRGGPRVFVGANWYGPSGTYAHAQTDYAESWADGTNGIAAINRGYSEAGVTDGLSNTLFVGDKRLNVALLGGFQGDDNEGYTAAWDHDTYRFTDAGHPPQRDPKTGDGGQCFGSSHTGGFVSLFGDGSVKFIPYSINPNTFALLGTINDGQVPGNY